jgi:phage recombination protein Bet
VTEIATRDGSALALTSDQSWWTDKQRAALAQLGVADASNADLAVFLHVAQRSGLDPFARQVYMIGRREKNKQDQWVTKQTIQTGIDGYRLIARRAADRAGEKLAEPQPLWCGRDGVWREAWFDEDPPAAAKVVVYRDGEPFAGVAMFAEFCQRDRSGNPTSMWRRMPANQLAKCAEAQALRRAFPQELAGIYVDEEMQQAANPAPRAARHVDRVSVDELDVGDPTDAAPRDRQPAPQGGSGTASSSAIGGPSDPLATDEHPVHDVGDDPRPITQAQVTRLILRLRDHNIETDDEQHAWLSHELNRDVASRKNLTRGELAQVDRVLDVLDEARGGAGGDEAGS